jgi:hypothetical protein
VIGRGFFFCWGGVLVARGLLVLLFFELSCLVLFCYRVFICCRQALERKGRGGWTDIRMDGWMDGWRRAGVMEQLFFSDYFLYGFWDGVISPCLDV